MILLTLLIRVNRLTGLAPKQNENKHTAHLVSLTNVKTLQKPKFKEGDPVRVAKKDLPFTKGYKQNYTDEEF